MDLAQFAALHVPTLEADEVRFSIHIALLSSNEMEVPLDLRLWSLGAPGHCIAQWRGQSCWETSGADQNAPWFVERAIAMGAEFELPIPQRICSRTQLAIPGLGARSERRRRAGVARMACCVSQGGRTHNAWCANGHGRLRELLAFGSIASGPWGIKDRKSVV